MCDVCSRNGEVKHHQQVVEQAKSLLQFGESRVLRGPGAALPGSPHRVAKHVPGVQGVHGFLVVEPLKVVVEFKQHTAKFFFVTTSREQKSQESFEDWFETGSNHWWRSIP